MKKEENTNKKDKFLFSSVLSPIEHNFSFKFRKWIDNTKIEYIMSLCVGKKYFYWFLSYYKSCTIDSAQNRHMS